MAKIAFVAGMSHTPLLAMPWQHWIEYSQRDYQNQALTLSDGRTLSYDALSAMASEKHDVSAAALEAKAKICQASLDRLAGELESAAPDVVVIVGDDQDELFGLNNLPLFSVFFGEEIVMHPRPIREGAPEFFKIIARNYAMDAPRRFPGHPELALEIIQGFLDRDVDVSSCRRVVDPDEAGFGHAVGFVIKRLFAERTIPVVPLLLNTYYPPNVPSAARCFFVGQQLRNIIESSQLDLRVAVIASGGLSHFVVDSQLDRQVLEGLLEHDAGKLKSIPRSALRSGSSEILNWLVVAGLVDGTGVEWSEYVPLYRTPAGTGVGAAFASWGKVSPRSPEAGPT